MPVTESRMQKGTGTFNAGFAGEPAIGGGRWAGINQRGQ